MTGKTGGGLYPSSQHLASHDYASLVMQVTTHAGAVTQLLLDRLCYSNSSHYAACPKAMFWLLSCCADSYIATYASCSYCIAMSIYKIMHVIIAHDGI